MVQIGKQNIHSPTFISTYYEDSLPDNSLSNMSLASQLEYKITNTSKLEQMIDLMYSGNDFKNSSGPSTTTKINVCFSAFATLIVSVIISWLIQRPCGKCCSCAVEGYKLIGKRGHVDLERKSQRRVRCIPSLFRVLRCKMKT